eukprot:jgi/Chlat1/1737/Chrsp13S02157
MERKGGKSKTTYSEFHLQYTVEDVRADGIPKFHTAAYADVFRSSPRQDGSGPSSGSPHPPIHPLSGAIAIASCVSVWFPAAMGMPDIHGDEPVAVPPTLAVECLPAPGFEGFEKRLELDFYLPKSRSDKGLRQLTRSQLDKMLQVAECTIISQLSNDYFDSYVLSESSLFVYPTKLVLKTCGTTALLKAVPSILELAGQLKMPIRRVKFSRGTFMFPQVQPYPHGSFEQETEFLERYFGKLAGGSRAFVLGDALGGGPHWHVYTADAEETATACHRTIEVCMTELDESLAAQFFRSPDYISAAETTRTSAISELIRSMEIDAFMFEPCGYSMNGVDGAAHSTIHVTPESGFSYASFEASGCGTDLDIHALLARVLCVFKPGRVSVAITIDGASTAKQGMWATSVSAAGYKVLNGTKQSLLNGGSVAFYNFTLNDGRPLRAARCELTATGTVAKGGSGSANCATAATSVTKKAMLEEQALLKQVSRHVDAGNLEAVYDAFGAVRLGGKSLSAEYDQFAKDCIVEHGLEETFYVMDLGAVERRWAEWTQLLPRVQAYYAVKCNPDNALLAVLAAQGAGFDVASKAELCKVMQLGVTPDRIVFSNPCKLPAHIAHAAAAGVHLMSFDAESELHKVKVSDPNARMLLRIRADDKLARCPLGVKYGAEMAEVEHLLLTAQKLGVRVEGVDFHVGSGASDPAAFSAAIEAARHVFELTEQLGLPQMTVLDIGGGFSGGGIAGGLSFADVAHAINAALNLHFPASSGVRVIAEPGRFFAESAAALASNIFGTRVRRSNSGEPVQEYWISDGLYGSMNCLLYDHATLFARPLQPRGDSAGSKQYRSTVFGPTCDGLDTVLKDTWLPPLACGDWLMFSDMGAYTMAAGSNFNGFDSTAAPMFYVRSSNASAGDSDSDMEDGDVDYNSEGPAVSDRGQLSSDSGADSDGSEGSDVTMV